MLTTEQARDAAIQQVEANADEGWLKAAHWAVVFLAEDGDPFTTDDIWEYVDRHGKPREPRAMGAVMKQAAAEGLIEATGEYRKSKRVECHARPVMVWRGKL